MEQEKSLEPIGSVDERKTYTKPQLVEYGRVGELTQGGIDPNNVEGGLYFLSSGT